MTFGTEAKVEFNLGDVETFEKASEAFDKVMYLGGATASTLALKKVQDVVVPFARDDSKRVMMFITDGRSNIGGPPKKAAENLREKKGFEIYSIGKVLHTCNMMIIFFFSRQTIPIQSSFFPLMDRFPIRICY